MFDLSAAELDIWRQWYEERGFPDDRAEWGRAIGSAYTGAVWGGKAKPAELIPRTRQRQVDDVAGVKAWFEQFSRGA